MAWLSLLLFLPWFGVMAGLYWWFPRQPRHRARTVFDACVLALALLVSVCSMHWGYRIGAADVDADTMWKQILAVLYAYGGFLAVMVLALLLRPRVLRRR
ncbi:MULTISPECIES: hypothetical protein [Stenotrophomonas]|uniref:Membrane protein n=1 Tax=Stenotrophomonas nitritireducens TaxID=83617 RepID=A0ABR5NIX2_9GAMM|nr:MULTISPECIES: hypothetical protein [Stenotrophomonas]KQO00322.1 hypothetical protein ASF01_05050 [Stenotrophomonas sp. Leaf70]KRG56787.1 membrane protein [Stenotrophomonas nitritireducens]MBN8791637.1 hypothetical protein [Stenotrophomonas nitritireducens]MBN8795575.1 hypothetical protein [Stenotrophomonas nitritireducens]